METAKPIKETGLLSSQLFSPAADGNIEPNALVLQKTHTHSRMHKHRFIYIYSSPQTKTLHESFKQLV